VPEAYHTNHHTTVTEFETDSCEPIAGQKDKKDKTPYSKCTSEFCPFVLHEIKTMICIREQDGAENAGD
jgi:hypothetical protein